MQPHEVNTAASPLEAAQLTSLQSLLDGLSPVQTAWVSGYLAFVTHHHLAAQPEYREERPVAAPAPAEHVAILYGSQTGNARKVAEALANTIVAAGLQARVASMNEYPPRNLAREKWLLLVVSTQGDGEPPENAYALHKFLHADRAPRLEHMQYAVLGLGDSSYARYCQAAKDFDQRLEALGARRLFDRVDCDVAFQSAADQWSTTVSDQLAQRIAHRPAENIFAVPARIATPRPRQDAAHDKDRPYAATVIENKRITASAATRDVRHVALSVDPQKISYQPGDALGVWFNNDPALVDEVLSLLALDGTDWVPAGSTEMELRLALTDHFELTRLHPTVVSSWARAADHPALNAIASDKERLLAFAREHQFADLMREYPASIDALSLAKLLQPMAPRLYSIASSPGDYSDEIHLTVGVLRHQGFGRERVGGASGFLGERCRDGATVRAYVVANPGFRPPHDAERPVVMIAAGTGIAPFRAFMQHRAGTGAPGKNWLIFGNRHFHRDFLYQSEWQQHRKAGVLTRADLAFSRDPGAKMYVQQRVLQQAPELYRWLEEGAHLYICGGASMGKAVEHALLEVIAQEARVTTEQARDRLGTLREQGRYQKDLY